MGLLTVEDLPLKQNELRAEGRTHGGQDTVAAGGPGVVEEVVLHDGEDRGCRKISNFAQALP